MNVVPLIHTHEQVDAQNVTLSNTIEQAPTITQTDQLAAITVYHNRCAMTSLCISQVEDGVIHGQNVVRIEVFAVPHFAVLLLCSDNFFM